MTLDSLDLLNLLVQYGLDLFILIRIDQILGYLTLHRILFVIPSLLRILLDLIIVLDDILNVIVVLLLQSIDLLAKNLVLILKPVPFQLEQHLVLHSVLILEGQLLVLLLI